MLEQKIKIFLFKKISTLIFLCWICNIDTYTSTHNKSLDKLHNHNRKLYARNYRSLEKYKQNKDSCIVHLMEQIPNAVNDKQDISNNEKASLVKKNYSNGSSPRSARGLQKNMKNKSCIFETKKYSHLEKKIFKELDYVDFLRRNKTLSDRIYKKIMLKKCRLRFALPLLLFLLLSISFILDYSCSLGLVRGLFQAIVYFLPDKVPNIGNLASKQINAALKSISDALRSSPLHGLFDNVVVLESGAKANYCVQSFFNFLIYFIPFFILGVILILAIAYYHKKVKKYEKIKFRKR
ncbi:fam-l protein [Plasmodium malariae]|uniref:Fam-l protein n=1 Tax=Plasmodium malariae TaxID=5858 RepID=A0A1D3TDN1_PLAMA|nr:fam-l protein [Plasmodium malariae]SCP02956.1 fam-l protein [Plasmodium malariae]